MLPNEHSKTEASCFVSINESSFKYFESATTLFFAQLSYVTSFVAFSPSLACMCAVVIA